MRVEKEYRHLEGIDEIRIFNASRKDFYNPTPKEFDVEDLPLQELINNIPVEIHSLVPLDEEKDFIIQNVGKFTLNKYNCTQNDVKGRRLSKLSPLFYEILYDELVDVYENHSIKKIRFVYYSKNKLSKLSNAKIVYDKGRIFVTTNNIDTKISSRADLEYRNFDEDKNDIMESFSQTGSCYNVNGKYTWSQGIYNIINRAKEDADDYYNIVFDLVIPEDKHIVNKIFEITNKETAQFEEIIRIKTKDGILKRIHISINSYYDESGIIVRQGLMNDITHYVNDELTKPVDFLLDGFKNSTKLALLMEPLNAKQYKFSKGFYSLVEMEPPKYYHSRDILNNIVEEEAVQKINKLINGELDNIDDTISYYVNGDPNNKKVVDLYIERFEHGNEIHSLGFLTDITEEWRKQEQLIASNDDRLILIKEIHHRVKNNLQVLNSFLNLEKRAYRNNPDLIIEHMQTRLTSLALLHEKTYNSQDFKNISLKDYLTDHDRQTTNVVDSPKHINFETIVDDDLNLSIEVITPLLLIIDEITMNAVKYAFPDKSSTDNRITKSIKSLDNDTAELIIKDNGVGLKDVNNITANLGCEIIKSLTKQLGGKISLMELEKGTGYRLVFPKVMEHTIE
ncbi:MAG: PAS domain-containing protein [Methanobrevibacter sp.]|uniref:histidine kinase dimerization/phosphoacceptor domain -containing protein n=1 Tax=Methanobrevibacter sp. TaxID=66852 RepID=UPI0025CBA747|nr:histidine kinase dimerization/phosphoacceptor domain -containing protein [Methanobrevibacter sp.]MBQ8018447.1 PAS domain-containing protein [Methanobrevibacter sp.]